MRLIGNALERAKKTRTKVKLESAAVFALRALILLQTHLRDAEGRRGSPHGGRSGRRGGGGGRRARCFFGSGSGSCLLRRRLLRKRCLLLLLRLHLHLLLLRRWRGGGPGDGLGDDGLLGLLLLLLVEGHDAEEVLEGSRRIRCFGLRRGSIGRGSGRRLRRWDRLGFLLRRPPRRLGDRRPLAGLGRHRERGREQESAMIFLFNLFSLLSSRKMKQSFSLLSLSLSPSPTLQQSAELAAVTPPPHTHNNASLPAPAPALLRLSIFIMSARSTALLLAASAALACLASAAEVVPSAAAASAAATAPPQPRVTSVDLWRRNFALDNAGGASRTRSNVAVSSSSRVALGGVLRAKGGSTKPKEVTNASKSNSEQFKARAPGAFPVQSLFSSLSSRFISSLSTTLYARVRINRRKTPEKAAQLVRKGETEGPNGG